jgi:choline dehydrogenase-like flavoprotein
MQIDLEGEATGTTYTSQICVLGGGIAGLVLARRLAQRGIQVHLLEAGGLDLEPRSQALYAAQMAADRHAGATDGRFRVFGGSSTRWGGQILPFTDDIFEPSPGTPSHPWPIAASAIEPYYADVMAILGVDSLPFEGTGLLRALGRPAANFGDGICLRFSKWAPFGRRNLANGIGRECLAHDRITVFTHANVTRLEHSGGRVLAAVARNYADAEFRFAAQNFAVCLGTIESSRLLLASAIGNQFDQVGRYFHDHVGVKVAELSGPARARILDRLGPFFVAGTLHTAKLEASAALRSSAALPAVMAHVVIEEPEDSGPAAVRNLLGSLQKGNIRAALGKNLLPMLRGLGDVGRLAWASRFQKRRAVSARARVWLKIDMEQVARANDRIRLSEAPDALGQPIAIVDWRVGDEERAAARAYAGLIKEQLEAAGISGLQWPLEDSASFTMEDTYHPMGGLRMGLDPQTSVVDPNLQVHGVENLSVASCAVFPAGGSSNPTFTMMALAMRLADRLAAAFPKT